MTGSCRHKASWLQQRVGGVVIFGRRTDRADAELHAALLVTIAGHTVVLDYDGCWPERSYPFARELLPQERPEPTWPARRTRLIRFN